MKFDQLIFTRGFATLLLLDELDGLRSARATKTRESSHNRHEAQQSPFQSAANDTAATGSTRLDDLPSFDGRGVFLRQPFWVYWL